jgi:hypothetical protein
MPANPVEFKVSLIRRAVRAAHREGMRVTHFDLLPDKTVRVYTEPEPPLDIDLDEICAPHSGAAA